MKLLDKLKRKRDLRRYVKDMAQKVFGCSPYEACKMNEEEQTRLIDAWVEKDILNQGEETNEERQGRYAESICYPKPARRGTSKKR